MSNIDKAVLHLITAYRAIDQSVISLDPSDIERGQLLDMSCEIMHMIEILKKISNNEPIEIVMRDATKEEQQGVNDYIKSISTPTGKSFYS